MLPFVATMLAAEVEVRHAAAAAALGRRALLGRASRVVDYALPLDADWFRRLFRYRESRDVDYGLLLDARLFLVATHSVFVAAAVRVSSLWPKQLPHASACAFWGALSSSSRL